MKEKHFHYCSYKGYLVSALLKINAWLRTNSYSMTPRSKVEHQFKTELTLASERPSNLYFLSLFLQQKKKVFLIDLKKAGITIMYTKGLIKQLNDVPIVTMPGEN